MIDAGAELGTEAARRLAALGRFTIGPGLSSAELAAVERRFAFEFADDHRAFLAAGLPAGRGWPDWRHGDPQELHERLTRPVDGVLFDVENDDFWYEGWGHRPGDPASAVLTARRFLATVPRMVPVYAHRYLPAGHGTGGHPVLSIMQTDVITYGADLADYLDREFGPGDGGTADRTGRSATATVLFWHDLL